METKQINIEINANAEQAENSVKNLRTQLREMRNALANLDEGSAEFANLTRQAGALQDRIGDINQRIRTFASDTRRLDVAVEGVQAVTGAFGVATAATALLGTENKNLEKVLMQTQAAMTLVTSVQAVANTLNRDSALMTTLNTQATKAATFAQATYATVVGTSTGAMKLFKLALAGTGIGLIVIALGALVTNFDKVKDAVLKVFPVLESVGKIIGGLVDGVTDFLGITSDATREADKAIEIAKANLAKNAQYLKENGDQISEYQKKRIEATNAYNQAIVDGEKNLGALQARARREIQAANDAEQAEKDKKQQEINEKAAAKRKEQADKIKAENDKHKADEAAFLENLKAENLKATQDQFQQLETKYKAEQELYKTNKAILKELDVQYVRDKKAIEGEQRKVFEESRTKYEDEEKQKKEDEINAQSEKLLADAEKDNTDFEARLQLIEQREAMINQLTFASQAEKTKFEQENTDARNAIAEQEAQFKENKLNAYKQSLLTAASLLGESTAAGKTAAIAATTIDTIQSGVSAFKGMVAAVPGPVGLGLGAVAAAGALASGYASVKKILAVKTPSGGSGGGAPSVGGFSAPSIPQAPKFNVVGSSGVNQLADVINKKDQQPIKTYVVSHEITKTQESDKNITKNASL